MKKNIKKFTVIVICLTCASCSHLPFAANLNNGMPEKIKNLHVNEDVSYPDSPFDEFVQKSLSGEKHYLNILNVGDDALLARIHLIRNAKKTINIQTFIWENDDVGNFIISELITAARRGVKIKLIIDYFSLVAKPALFSSITEASASNLEIKLYNPLASRINPLRLEVLGSWALNFNKSNQRMHNKVFIIDDRMAIVGGRNYANDYFDRGEKRNFKDRDILVIGHTVRDMTDSFMKYWSFKLSVNVNDMLDVKKIIEKRKSKGFNTKIDLKINDLFDDVYKCTGTTDCIKERFISNIYDVQYVQFVADAPGKKEKIGKYKTSATANALLNLFSEAEKSIVIQTPYLIVGKKVAKIFSKLRSTHPKIDILVSSNSLAAADHAHAYAFSFKNKKKYVKKFKWQIFELKPLPKDMDVIVKRIEGINRTKDYYTCIHAKSYIFDDRVAWIGSFNIDPRSKRFNTETGLIVYDSKVARALKKDVMRDMAPQNSWTIGKQKDVPLISTFSGLIDDIMDIVPIVHVWPFQFTTSFEIKEGKQEIPYYHEKFYDHYVPVGQFPKAQLTQKEIKTRFIKSFMGPIEGLM